MLINEIVKVHPQITEINKVVGIYEIHIDGIQPQLKIKILKHELRDAAKFMGIPNLGVKGSQCADYYQSMHLVDTEEDALFEAIRGFFCFLDDKKDICEFDDW